MKSEAFQEYEKILRELISLEVDGEPSDSEEAEALRDESDPIWYKLTEEEKNELRQISSSLSNPPSCST